MEKGYYTPKIEEFHIGFRYEYNSESFSFLDYTKGSWKKEKFIAGCGMDGESEIDDIYNLVDEGKVRVKYLDREDLEELGWEYKGKHWFYKNDEYFHLSVPHNKYDYVDHYYLHVHDGNFCDFSIVEGNESGYSLEGGHHVFYSISDKPEGVKNYNELKRLMEQLRII